MHGLCGPKKGQRGAIHTGQSILQRRHGTLEGVCCVVVVEHVDELEEHEVKPVVQTCLLHMGQVGDTPEDAS